MKVFVTGLGCVSPLGLDLKSNMSALWDGACAVQFVEEWSKTDGLNCHLGAFVPSYPQLSLPRSKRRTMSKMSEFIFLATQEALQQAQISSAQLNELRSLICVGSTTGSPIAFDESLAEYHQTKSFRGQLSNTIFKCMSHSAGINLAAALDFSGALISSNSACTSGSLAIVLGYEMIKSGLYDCVVAGGCDENHITTCASFDLAFAASRKYNQSPSKASRPFDQERDGIVVSEGAGILVLESEKSVERRQARVLAELLGGAYSCDGSHMTQPQVPTMIKTMKETLHRAQISSDQVDYVNAHATSTPLGDLEEARAIHEVFARPIPVSSVKGSMGHPLGAAGSIEAALSVQMILEKKVIANLNLEQLDPKLPELDYVKKNYNDDLQIVLSNNFAFGGINTSLLFGKVK